MRIPIFMHIKYLSLFYWIMEVGEKKMVFII